MSPACVVDSAHVLLQEEERKGGKKGRLLGVITLSDVLRYVIGEAELGESPFPGQETPTAPQEEAAAAVLMDERLGRVDEGVALAQDGEDETPKADEAATGGEPTDASAPPADGGALEDDTTKDG